MRLKHYWASGGSVEFDPESGEVSGRSRGSVDSEQWGIVWKQRGRWFAIWRGDDALVFQHGRRRWNLNSDMTFDVSGRYWRTFRIRRQGAVEFKFSYWFKGSVIAHIDPTYDGLDEETDDYFLYVSRMWEYWKDRDLAEFMSDADEPG